MDTSDGLMHFYVKTIKMLWTNFDDIPGILTMVNEDFGAKVCVQSCNVVFLRGW